MQKYYPQVGVSSYMVTIWRTYLAMKKKVLLFSEQASYTDLIFPIISLITGNMVLIQYKFPFQLNYLFYVLPKSYWLEIKSSITQCDTLLLQNIC